MNPAFGRILTVNWLLLAALAVALATMPVHAGGISGTLSNFDTFYDNTTTPDKNAYGAELELEGVHLGDVSNTYPSHYNNKTMVEYSDGVNSGTRITFTGYNFDPSGYIAPTPNPQTTNGHTCVGTPGCEHFGFSVVTQPTAMRFYWHDENGARIGTAPLTVPNPTWTYIPPVVPGNPPRMAAVVEIEPVEAIEQMPDSIWMKVYKTEIERKVELEELISGVLGGVVPEDEVETESEWELLEGGIQGGDDKEVKAEDDIGEGHFAVLRRYEYFKYTGLYSEEHEPLSVWDGVSEPPADELGDFIAANMVAANLVPEPSSVGLALSGAGLFLLALRRREER